MNSRRRKEATEPVQVSPEEHRRALEEIERQSAELAALRARHEKPVNSNKVVPKYLQCPLCFTGYGGTAVRRKWHRQINGSLQRRCYVCGECGNVWEVEVRSEETDDGMCVVTTKVVKARKSE